MLSIFLKDAEHQHFLKNLLLIIYSPHPPTNQVDRELPKYV